MCVIIYKPAGKELPSLDILDKAYRRNPHGCGVVSPNVLYKGLSYTSFKKNLKRCNKEEPLLIHFRYATHGSVKKSNCHPFYDQETETYFMHNGIIGGINPPKDKTDSECAFRRILQPYIKRYGLDSVELLKTANQVRGFHSKFAFIQGDNVRLFGEFFHFQDCYFSNLRFL